MLNRWSIFCFCLLAIFAQARADLPPPSGPLPNTAPPPSLIYPLHQGQFTLAPGAPGTIGSWARPDKQGFATTLTMPVWATIADGILTEVNFPQVDRSQTRDTELLIVVGSTFLEEKRDFQAHVSRYPHSLAYHVSSVDPANGIQIDKDIIPDPARPVVIVNYNVTFPAPVAADIYLLHNPQADNTAGGDAAFVYTPAGAPAQIIAFQSDRRGDEPPAYQRRSVQLLMTDQPATIGSAGFEGVSDGWTQLANTRQLRVFQSAVNGNVAATLGFHTAGTHFALRFALAFALEDPQDTINVLRNEATASLSTPPNNLLGAQQQAWGSYLSTLNAVGQRAEIHPMVLKALMDKEVPGAIVAGISVPSLPDSINAVEADYEGARTRRTDTNGGYHRVWIRDAVQMALGFLAAGDYGSALAIAQFLTHIQLANGNFPQNTWADGTPSWTGFQLDQTGFPILLVSRLVELGVTGYEPFRGMVVKAAEAIMANGPWTQMDRWEEHGGLSPNTIAVACQGLTEASWLEQKSNPARAQAYGKTCQQWQTQIYQWAYVSQGALGSGYFERFEISNPPNPSVQNVLDLANKPWDGDAFPEDGVVDGGFIQWIISGLLPANDPRMTSALAIYDRVARATTPHGRLGYLRYNHDGYGLNHRGGTWPLLAGERALAALERHEDATEYLPLITDAITPTGLIPEQDGVSACPLGWAHANALILARSLSDGRSFYIPRHALAAMAFRSHIR